MMSESNTVQRKPIADLFLIIAATGIDGSKQPTILESYPKCDHNDSDYISIMSSVYPYQDLNT